jgi:hypothetical protein
MGRQSYLARIAEILLAAMLISCGGGEHYDDHGDYFVPYMGGLWRGHVSLQQNECGLSLVRNYNIAHSVWQSEDSIELEDEEHRRFSGRTVGEDGFSVDAFGPSNIRLTDGRICNFTYRYRYESIHDNDDPTADVRFFILGECSNNTSCESEYAGDASRD